MFRHPKYYKELRKLRNKLDQAISLRAHDGERERATGPGPKRQAASNKPDSWPNSSSVITKDQPWFGATSRACPAPKQNNECKDCRACWDPEIKNISYWAH